MPFALRQSSYPLRRSPVWPPGGATRIDEEPPEYAGARRKAPRLRAISHREVGDQRRAEGDGKAGVGPLLEPRRHRRKQQHHAEELGPRQLHPEVGGEAEVRERLRDLRQEQLRVGGEACLQAEQRGDGPEADDDSLWSGAGPGPWARGRRCLLLSHSCRSPCQHDGSHRLQGDGCPPAWSHQRRFVRPLPCRRSATEELYQAGT